MIQPKALSLISHSNPGFKASEGWLQKFMVRNSLSLRRHTSIQQKLPAALEKKLGTLLDNVKTLHEHYNFPENLIINMDEYSLTCREHVLFIQREHMNPHSWH
jgi:hypothetical protein